MYFVMQGGGGERAGVMQGGEPSPVQKNRKDVKVLSQ